MLADRAAFHSVSFGDLLSGRLAAGLAVAALAAIVAGPALGQQVVPTVEPGQIQKRFKAPLQPKSTIEPVVPEGEEAVPPAGAAEIKFTLSGIVVEGSTVYEDADFLPLYESLLGKEISLADVYGVANAVSAKYRGDGYILSRAVVLAQRIRGGVVRLQAVEGFINEVIIEGDIAGRESLLESYGRKIAAARPVNAADLERYLLLADDLPGVDAKAVLTPSAEVAGASDLVLFIDHKDMSFAAAFDNRGTRFVGPYQITARANFNSLMGLYEQTRFRWIGATQTEELRFFEVTHEETIGSEGTRAILSYTLTRSRPGFILQAARITSDAESATLLVTHPVIRSRSENLAVRASFQYTKQIIDILAGTQLFSDDRLRILRVGATYDFVDQLAGINLIDVEASQGLDIFNATESGTATAPSRVNGKSDFFKITGDYSRLQRLAPGWTLLGALSGQYSFSQLLSPEEFGVGGAQFGRAYDPSEIAGDHGLAGKLELQYGHTLEWAMLQDFQLYAFYDLGATWKIDPLGVDPQGQDSISSMGVGVRFNINSFTSGFIEINNPLTRNVAARGPDGGEPRAFFSLAMRF